VAAPRDVHAITALLQRALDDDTDLRQVILTALEKLFSMKAETPAFRDARRKQEKGKRHERVVTERTRCIAGIQSLAE
jgi:hypothetical protein